MTHLNCTWCQKKADPLSLRRLPEGAESHYLCPDCLIDLLPKTPLTDREIAENPADEGERRRTERFPVYAHAYLTVREISQPRILGAVILDISTSGMKILLDQPFDVDETIILTFYGEQLIFKAICRIMRCQMQDNTGYPSYEIGTRFIGIHQELR